MLSRRSAACEGAMNGTHLFTTNDGVKIAYENMGKAGPAVVLIHGWSGSRHSWDRNLPIARHCRLFTYDQRFHGDSDKPKWGYRVARLAADLRDFLAALQLQDVTVVGSSMGAAVIWAYIELFGEERLARAVFVDQAPLQNVAPDWKLGSKGCYDVATLARLQTLLDVKFEAVAEGNLKGCLSRPLGPGMEEALKAETLRADPDALGRLMADHTQIDWRPLLPHIRIECLNLVGRQSGVFPWQGCAVIGELIPNCHTVYFEACNHWLYIEEPDQFNHIIVHFATEGLPAVRKWTTV